jgi:hypothetical protein
VDWNGLVDGWLWRYQFRNNPLFHWKIGDKMLTIALLIIGGSILFLTGIYLIKKDDSMKSYLTAGTLILISFGMLETGIFFFAMKCIIFI